MPIAASWIISKLFKVTVWFCAFLVVITIAYTAHLHATSDTTNGGWKQPSWRGSNPVVDANGASDPYGHFSKQPLGKNTAGLPEKQSVIVPDF